MTVADKRTMFKNLIGDATLSDTVVDIYLSIAEDMILNRRYPFGRPNGAMLESRYEMLQVRLAVAVKQKADSGTEADMLSHEESAGGTSVRDTYANLAGQGMSQYATYLREVVPYAKVVC